MKRIAVVWLVGLFGGALIASIFVTVSIVGIWGLAWVIVSMLGGAITVWALMNI